MQCNSVTPLDFDLLPTLKARLLIILISFSFLYCLVDQGLKAASIVWLFY